MVPQVNNLLEVTELESEDFSLNTFYDIIIVLSKWLKLPWFNIGKEKKRRSKL